MSFKIKRKRFCRSVGRPIDGRPVVAGIACVTFAGLLSRFLSGSPYRMLCLVGIRRSLPPIWVFSLAWLLSYVLLGFCFGAALGSRTLGREIHKYKGSFFFVIMMVFNIIWYPLFFKAGAVFLSLVDSAFVLIFCLLAALEYHRLRRCVGVCMFVHLAWIIYCFALNMSIFLKA